MPPSMLQWKDLKEIKMNKETARYHREQYKTLIARYGCTDFNAELNGLVSKQWDKLFDVKAEKYPTFAQLEYTGQRWGISDLKENILKENSIKKNVSKNFPRHCVTCGRDISDQKAGSRFCSERLYGKAAKQCRNKDSNKRLSIKRRINRAIEKDVPVTVTYHNSVKVCIEPARVNYKNLLLNCITSVEALPIDIMRSIYMKSKHKYHTPRSP